ncbi:ankyrin repeat domain-containing protein 31 [Ctenodactylus gundi]
MEEGAQAAGWDSDETVIEGSVTESDLDDEELPWRRFLFDQDTSLTSEFSLHPGVSGVYKGKETIFQYSQYQFLKLDFHCIIKKLQELSEDRDSLETSLLSGTAITASGVITINETPLAEPEKILSAPAAPTMFSGHGKETTWAMTSKEINEEDSSLETFVSAMEKSLTSPENSQDKRLLEIINDFDPGELTNPLSNLPSPVLVPLKALSACCRDLPERTKDDALPPELFEALKTLSEAEVAPICHRKEEFSSCSAGNEYLEVEPVMSQTDEDCTQITEVNFESLCSSLTFEQESRLAQEQDSTVEDLNPLESHHLTQEKATSCEPVSNKGSSDPMENASDQETSHVVKRSSRLKKLKVSQDANSANDKHQILDEILPKIPCCKDQINNKPASENFRIQDPVLMNENKMKTIHSSRFKSEDIKKNGRLKLKKEKMKISKMPLCAINRRNIFGENMLYKAVLHGDADIVHLCIKKGANVNQPSYAGWTALHEASVKGFYRIASELLKGGADVNIKGMYQITPLHDAVINGHHKLAELLLLSGADPLLRSDNGRCALDEAKDMRMKRLLEKYVPKPQKYLTSARRKSTDPADLQRVHQCKKPKFSSKNRTGFVCYENSNVQKPKHVEVNKGTKESLCINKDVYEHYQKDSKTTKVNKSKPKQSAVTQLYNTGLRKGNLRNVKRTNTYVLKGRRRRNTQHKRTQVDDGDCTSRQSIAVSSLRRTKRLVQQQQPVLQTLNDLPKESREPSSPILPTLKNGLSNDFEICSVPGETHAHNLDLSTSQEMQFLRLESIDQNEAVSFPGPVLHKEDQLSPVSADQQPHAHQVQHNNSYKTHKKGNSGEKQSFSKWENSFLSSIKENVDNDGDDDDISKKAVTSEKLLCSTECESHCSYKENLTNEEKEYHPLLSPEHHFSQANELKADSLTTLPQQEVANLSDSYKAAISGHVANYEQGMDDQSSGSPKPVSPACTRAHSTHEISELTIQMELLKQPQDNSPRELPLMNPLMNQTGIHSIEKLYVEQKQYAKIYDTDKGQSPGSSNRPFPIVVHSQVTEITDAERKEQDLLESEHNPDFHSTDNMNEELTSIAKLNHKQKEISHKSDEELSNDISGDENTIRNCEDKKEKDLEIHMPSTKEHKKSQNLKKRLKTTYNQEKKTAAFNKQNARGESQLPLAAKGGDSSLGNALIESDEDGNLNDKAVWMPLHEVSNEGLNDVIGELLKAGANVNYENVDEILPLHDAVASSPLKPAEILLQNGANPKPEDQPQETVLNEADNENTKELLKSYSAVETNSGDESNAAVTTEKEERWQNETLQQIEATPVPDFKTPETQQIIKEKEEKSSGNQEETNRKARNHEKTAENEANAKKRKMQSRIITPASWEEDQSLQTQVKYPTVRPKRRKQHLCDNDETIDLPSFSWQENRRESLPMHQIIKAILRDIEEKQEKLLDFEIRSPEDAEQYIEKMLGIKEIMDNVLAKQKEERDDLAKKYRVSRESFKHGALREQLANLATRQKKLLVIAKTQKKISLKIQNYKNVTSFPGLSLRKLLSSSDTSSKHDSQELASLENLVQPQSGSFSPLSHTCGSIQETPLSLETGNYGQHSNVCLDSEADRMEIFKNEMNSKNSENDCALDDPEKMKLSRPVVFIAQAESSQKENNLTETIAKDREFYSSSAVTGTLNTPGRTSVLFQNDAHLSADIWDQKLSYCKTKTGDKKTVSQQPPGGTSESLVHQGRAPLGIDAVQHMKPNLKKTASAVSHVNNSQTSSSGPDHQRAVKKPLNFSTASKKKFMQIKDLILLGRIKPGNNILEFKAQETTHKASVLLSGKIKIDSGQIYKSPVTWLKDLLGAESCVTWNYAWSKITYLGKDLLTYASEEGPLPEPSVVPPQHRPCLPGTSKESMRTIPHYLQINEILLISDQEFLPCHLMDQHWKFYVECEELAF